jgi:hypothetical protein
MKSIRLSVPLATVFMILLLANCRSTKGGGSATLNEAPTATDQGAFVDCKLNHSRNGQMVVEPQKFIWLNGRAANFYGISFTIESINLFPNNNDLSAFGSATWELELKGKFAGTTEEADISFNLPLGEEDNDPVVLTTDIPYIASVGWLRGGTCKGPQIVSHQVLRNMLAANADISSEYAKKWAMLSQYKFTSGKIWDCFVPNVKEDLDLVSWKGGKFLTFSNQISGNEIQRDTRLYRNFAPIERAAIETADDKMLLKFVGRTSATRYYGELVVADNESHMPSSLTVWERKPSGDNQNDFSLSAGSGSTSRTYSCPNPRSWLTRKIARDFVSQFQK